MALPDRDLKEALYPSCAVVGSSGILRRSGYGPYIDQHEVVMRFNGAPAGGGYAADVGSRTTVSVLADVISSDCISGRAKQMVASKEPPELRENQLEEASPVERRVSGCAFYPEQSPPPAILFIPRRGSAQKLLEYGAKLKGNPRVYIRSDAFGKEVDSQVQEYEQDNSHPTSGFNGVNLALHICATLDIYGFGSPRAKYFSASKLERQGRQHLYRSEARWLLALEHRFPGRVRVWP